MIYKQLADYRSGKRLWGVMNGMAKALSVKDSADVAGYFAGRPGGLPASPDVRRCVVSACSLPGIFAFSAVVGNFYRTVRISAQGGTRRQKGRPGRLSALASMLASNHG